MKIAFLVGIFPALTETFIINQITGLLDLGHHVEIFSFLRPKKNPHSKIIQKYQLMQKVTYLHPPKNIIHRIIKALSLIMKRIHKNPKEILKSLNCFKYGKKALSLSIFYMLMQFLDKKFDIIHSHFGSNGIEGMSLEELGVHGKYLTSFHGWDVNRFPRIKGANVYKSLFKKGELFTTNSNFTRQQLVKLGCNESKITILPMGIEINKFKFSIKKIKPNETIIILTVGRLVEKKGHFYGIKAIKKVLEKRRNLLYNIIGDGPEKTSLKALILELGLEDHVKLRGNVPQDTLLEFYKQAHIFLLPSVTSSLGDREGQAIVIQEAQAAGLPIVSTLHNGIPEGMVDEKSGFLVPERNIDGLAEKLDYLIQHSEIWPELGKFGRNFVEGRYNIEKLNHKLERIYQRLIDI